MSEQRHFHRVPFEASTLVDHAGKQHVCQLVDISLQGALFDAPEELPIRTGDSCTLKVLLPSADQSLDFEGQLVHRSARRYGFRFRSESDSTMTHLRRLLELNLGNGDTVDREIEDWLTH